jgi:BioD-like phosphotransacetylase family protein
LVALYITSSERGSGKTAVCAGLGKHLLDERKKIGFFKPVITDGKKPAAKGADSDAEFIKNLLSLKESPDLLCPALSSGSKLASNIKEAYAKVSQGKDIVIIEGPSEQYQASPDIVKALNARVLIVESYSKDLSKTIDSYKSFGKSLLGVVLNKVPESRMEQARSEASARLNKAGVNIIGVLPEDRSLLAPTMGELVECIKGEVLRGAEQSAELVENLMLGAMVVDPGPYYFGRKSNKAAIIRSDRPDMQMAAMETSTTCLVLTGDTEPKSVVLDRAEEKNVPIVLTRDDAAAVMANIEDALGITRFNQEKKMPRLEEIMEQHLDFQAVYKGLGLAG